MPDVEEPSTKLQELVAERGRKIEGYEVTRLRAEDIASVMEEVGLSVDQRILFKALKGLLPNFAFVFGSAQELNRLKENLFPEHENSEPIQRGQIDLENGLIYIANQSGETVLHEMVHAVLAQKIFAYYKQPSLLTKDEQTAFKNLETLMGEFRGLTFGYDAAPVRGAAETAQNQIETALAFGSVEGQAMAMNEFLAWSMTNQNLING